MVIKLEIGIVIFRTLFFYFLVILLYRLMGKREIGELSVVDLVISILIAELVAISIDNVQDSIWLALLPILLLSILQIIMSLISLKNTRIRDFIDGKPSVIINNGKLMFKEMIKQRYNLDDLLTQLREKNVKSIDEVEYAILETSGKLSIFSKEEDKKGDFPLPLVLDGQIDKETLNYLNKDEAWLEKNLKEDLNNVFYAFYRNNSIYIIKKDELV